VCLPLMLVAALASFPLIERMPRQPMFDLSLPRKPAFAGGQTSPSDKTDIGGARRAAGP
jgi:hypothetical protein